jgi:hypothetical protein
MMASHKYSLMPCFRISHWPIPVRKNMEGTTEGNLPLLRTRPREPSTYVYPLFTGTTDRSEDSGVSKDEQHDKRAGSMATKVVADMLQENRHA